MRFLCIGLLLGGGCGGSAEEFVDTDTDITWENNAPEAVDDTTDARPDMLQSVNVLGNDADPDNEVLTITAVTESDNATIEISDDGGLVYYTANTDFTGSDSFTYTVSDPWGLTDDATVTVDVQANLVLMITYPSEGEVVDADWTGADTADTGAAPEVTIEIEYDLTGCTGSSPSQKPDDCHIHRWIDGVKFPSFGWYTTSPITDMTFTAGEHTVKLQVIKNDGSDAPFSPVIEDEVTFTVQ